MGTLLRHGSDAHKKTFLPRIAKGELRLRRSASPSPSPAPRPPASRRPRRATATATSSPGRDLHLPRAQSDLLLLLARTTAYDELEDKTHGIRVPRRLKAAVGREEDRDPSDRDDAQPPHDRALHRWSRARSERPGRQGSQGSVTSSTRGTPSGSSSRRSRSATAAVRRARRALRRRARGLWPAHRREPGCSSRSRRRTRSSSPLDYCATRPRGSSTGASRAAPKRTWRSSSRRRPRGLRGTRRWTRSVDTRSRRNTTSSEVPRDASLPHGAGVNNNLVLAYVAEHISVCRAPINAYTRRDAGRP